MPTAVRTAAKKKVAGKVAADWERIELTYRAGILSLREIAEGSGVSHVAISKRAKKQGWVRDLSAKITAKADELVNTATVNRPVNSEKPVSERDMVDGVAQVRASVQLEHRRDIHRGRKLVNSLLDELEQQTDAETLERLREMGECRFGPGPRAQGPMVGFLFLLWSGFGVLPLVAPLPPSSKQAFGYPPSASAPARRGVGLASHEGACSDAAHTSAACRHHVHDPLPLRFA